MRLRNRIGTAALLGVMSLLAFGARTDAAPANGKPPLVVVIVIDQFRADYLTRFAHLFDKNGGFARFAKGTQFTNANYGHATTYTGPGHAHLFTGAYANQNGIVGNKWFDREKGKSVSAAADSSSKWLTTGDEGDGTSPKNLLVTTVGDELVLNSQGRSKVITMALKSRSAIMMAGKLGKAFWFNEQAGGFTTSSYYHKEMPGYVKTWNDKKVADQWFGKEWTPSVPESAFVIASEDAFPQEGDLKGLGRTFPHKITGKLDKPGEDYYDTLGKTPFANDMELDFAKAVITAEKLGKDSDSDLLAISLSANDEAGHTFGPYSREVLDFTVRTDKQLGDFLRWLDKAAPGATVVLTADHGASPIPEYMARMGVDAHRIKKATLKDAVEAALDKRFGAADWVVAQEDPSIYLADAVITQKKLARAEVEKVAADSLLAVPGIARTFTRSELMAGLGDGWIEKSYQVVFHPVRSGDVLILCKPYSFWGKYAETDYGDSHGSPYSYDTHVPLAFIGKGITARTVADSVTMADFAPTVATILGVNQPTNAEGKVLGQVFGK